MRRDTGSYVHHRATLYALLWLFAVSEFGLTSYHIFHTNTSAGFYGDASATFVQRSALTSAADPIAVELLFTALITLLWIPYTVFFHHRPMAAFSAGNNTLKSTRVGARAGFSLLQGESYLKYVLSIMWPVGALVATSSLQTPLEKEGLILLAIVAFAWIPYGLLMLAIELEFFDALGHVHAGPVNHTKDYMAYVGLM
ncbi:hypothetical protein DFH11DRAFT_400954 [Phellopilus nigrolimitatus]|nr:hypothetical protein DFH11DRAFT_400954 [Phellopilus nigrolimitatus]